MRQVQEDFCYTMDIGYPICAQIHFLVTDLSINKKKCRSVFYRTTFFFDIILLRIYMRLLFDTYYIT